MRYLTITAICLLAVSCNRKESDHGSQAHVDDKPAQPTPPSPSANDPEAEKDRATVVNVMTRIVSMDIPKEDEVGEAWLACARHPIPECADVMARRLYPLRSTFYDQAFEAQLRSLTPPVEPWRAQMLRSVCLRGTELLKPLCEQHADQIQWDKKPLTYDQWKQSMQKYANGQTEFLRTELRETIARLDRGEHVDEHQIDFLKRSCVSVAGLEEDCAALQSRTSAPTKTTKKAPKKSAR